MSVIINNNGKGARVINTGGRVIKNMVIRDGKITIDGKMFDEYMNEQENAPVRPVITIQVTGDVERIECDECKGITITGNCRRVKTNMGDINIGGDVDGDVHTNMGSIECGNVGGDATTNMGSVHYKRD